MCQWIYASALIQVYSLLASLLVVSISNYNASLPVVQGINVLIPLKGRSKDHTGPTSLQKCMVLLHTRATTVHVVMKRITINQPQAFTALMNNQDDWEYTTQKVNNYTFYLCPTQIR